MAKSFQERKVLAEKHDGNESGQFTKHGKRECRSIITAGAEAWKDRDHKIRVMVVRGTGRLKVRLPTLAGQNLEMEQG